MYRSTLGFYFERVGKIKCGVIQIDVFKDMIPYRVYLRIRPDNN